MILIVSLNVVHILNEVSWLSFALCTHASLWNLHRSTLNVSLFHHLKMALYSENCLSVHEIVIVRTIIVRNMIKALLYTYTRNWFWSSLWHVKKPMSKIFSLLPSQLLPESSFGQKNLSFLPIKCFKKLAGQILSNVILIERWRKIKKQGLFPCHKEEQH